MALALLSGTLRTYQRAGCDRELVTLSCPRGTSISIEIAQYGRSGALTVVMVEIENHPDVISQHLSHGTTSFGRFVVVVGGSGISVKAPADGMESKTDPETVHANERNLCPASTEDALDISIPGTEIEIKAPESCTWPNALQVQVPQTDSRVCVSASCVDAPQTKPKRAG
uniref:Uncharacterized protein n=1 Tax=Anopheles melas TaxID=34690 RepID=A0A182UEL2_9DIPT